jgi:hypothetical protein
VAEPFSSDKKDLIAAVWNIGAANALATGRVGTDQRHIDGVPGGSWSCGANPSQESGSVLRSDWPMTRTSRTTLLEESLQLLVSHFGSQNVRAALARVVPDDDRNSGGSVTNVDPRKRSPRPRVA